MTWARRSWQWVMFVGLIILVWVFMMRRMGGPGGPGGQIFNIGKSRAQVFEGSKTTNVTFNDVAGWTKPRRNCRRSWTS